MLTGGDVAPLHGDAEQCQVGQRHHEQVAQHDRCHSATHPQLALLHCAALQTKTQTIQGQQGEQPSQQATQRRQSVEVAAASYASMQCTCTN